MRMLFKTIFNKSAIIAIVSLLCCAFCLSSCGKHGLLHQPSGWLEFDAGDCHFVAKEKMAYVLGDMLNICLLRDSREFYVRSSYLDVPQEYTVGFETVKSGVGSVKIRLFVYDKGFPRKKSDIKYVHNGKDVVILVEAFPYQLYGEQLYPTDGPIPSQNGYHYRSTVKEGVFYFSTLNQRKRNYQGNFDIEFDLELLNNKDEVVEVVPVHFSNGVFKSYYSD